MAKPNLIPNPGFETGIDGWTSTIAALSWERTTTHSGTGALKAVPTGNGITVRGPAPSIVDVGYGNFVGTMWVRITAAAARQVRPAIRWRDAGGAQTAIVGALTSPAVDTWTELSLTGNIPSNAVDVQLYLDSPTSGGLTAADSVIIDDVTLGPQVWLTVSSVAASLGYGYWSFFGQTEPAAPAVAYTTTAYPSGPSVSGNTQSNGAAFDTLSTPQADDGPNKASFAVTGAGTGYAVWTMNDVELQVTTIEPGLVEASLKWAAKGGEGELGDAWIVWDSTDLQFQYGSMLPADYAEGWVHFGRHQYPVDPNNPATFEIIVNSGKRGTTYVVEVPASGRATLTTEDGTQVAVCDIQEWPDHNMARAAAVLPVVGRAEPVVLLDALRLPSSQITFLTLDAAESNALLEVLRYPGRIHLVSPCSGVENIWFTALSTTRTRLTNTGGEVRRLWPTQIQEVSAPA